MVKNKVCAYCGNDNPKTKDHIPPKGVFAKPLPKDLITVPCCSKCHEGTSEDDLYFRTILLTSSNLIKDEKAMKQMKHAINSLRKPKRAKLAQSILNSLTEAEIVSEAGLILGKQPAIRIDHDRIERVLVRIVRGLYFKELGSPLLKSNNVFAQIDQFGKDATTLSSEGVFEPVKMAADGMFGYTYARAKDKKEASVWLGIFYQKVSFVGFTGIPRKRNTF